MIERLVQQGLLERSEDPKDRRMRQVLLTARGRALAEESVRARQSWMRAVIRKLTPAQQKEIVAALSILTAAAQSLEPGEQAEHDPVALER
jgi:DNA-binding MarR family transcriptional regulator